MTPPRTRPPDTVIDRYLDTYGQAPVLVVLKEKRWKDKPDEPLPRDHFLEKLPKRKAAADRGIPEKPPEPKYFPELGVQWGYVDRSGHENLIADAAVAGVYDAAPLTLPPPVQVTTPDLPGPGQLVQHLKLINVEPLWDRGLTGKEVKVGHLDTGVDGTHEAFRGNRIAKFAQFDFDGNQVPNAPARDSARHGTHTAATICGGPVDGVRIGVAPKAQLYSAMVIEGGDTLLRVLAGLEWLLREQVQIINLSLGVPGYTPLFEAVVDRLRERGALVVCAIGNEGVHKARSPGNYEQVLSVGAAENDRWVAHFSGSSAFLSEERPFVPDVVAPGVKIISARAGGGVVSMDGSSMAAALATGVAALLKEAKPDAGPAVIESCITHTSRPLREASPWRQGHGMIDGDKAYGLIMAPPPPGN